MACLARLKSDICELSQLFPKNHPLFRVTHVTVDELTCSFIVKDNSNGERKYVINANITETYPIDPPVWFSESDEISQTLQELSSTNANNNYVNKNVQKKYQN